jgi:carboxylate-amine ligase
MDAQTSLQDVAALVAFTRALVVAEASDRLAPERLISAPEVLDENRFLAARDGMDAEFVDPRTRSRVPARVLVEEMVECTRLYAQRLGCADELLDVLRLAADPPAERQRAAAGAHGLEAAIAGLSDAFCAPRAAAADSETALAV